MSKSNACENSLLLLIFNNTAFANIGNAGGLPPSTLAGSLYLSLHTADPGETGDQTTSEATYVGYARQPVARSAAGFTVTANSVNLTTAISFPAGTGGAGTVTFFGIGTSVSGAGVLLYSGTVTPNIVTGNGITPQLTTAAGLVTED
jgi:hypothetical protein